ncbi:MAG: efflux RND transporter permease subunit [Bacteroidales bacterium]|nr:efflux RND transporter permease subunit [Bacteroidales bacterium]
MLCITVGGIMSFKYLSKLEDPEIKVMIAKVVTVYPGASAHEVELQVTNVLEEELSKLADIEKIRSTSQPNVSTIDIELKMTVPQEEIEQRWEFMRRKLQLAAERLPQGIQAQLIYDDFADVYGMFYAMTAKGFSYQEMAAQADYIRRGILEVKGVRKVEVYGVQDPVIEIELSADKMARLGVLPLQVISTINAQNATVYAGSVQTGNQLMRLTVNDKLKTISDLENLIISGINGQQFKLSDLATITKTYNNPLRNTFALNNEKALGISMSMESGENIIEVGKRVEARLAEMQKNIPAGYEFTKVFFQPDKVQGSINDFMKNLVASVGIVILVLMVVMGLRGGLIIGIGLLLTILATFPVLLVADGSLQRISLGAFIIAMGMLVDNAIVVIDGIVVDLQVKGRRKLTFTSPAKRTAMPLLGATLIAITAFLPVFLSKDTAGTYARDLFIVLAISLLISWVLALTQVPLFSAIFMRKTNKKNTENPYDGRMFRVLEKSLSFLMDHKITTVFVATVLLLLAAYNFKNVKQTFFPDFNYNQVYIEYKLPSGTGPARVQNDLREITRYFLSLNQVKMVVTSQGMSPTRYCLVRPVGEPADNYGELIVDFEDYATMIEMKPILEKYLHDNYPEATSRIRKYNLSIKSTHLVEVEFTGPDPAVLRDLSKQAENAMRNNIYANTFTIGNNWQPKGMVVNALFDQYKARTIGTSRQDVGNALLVSTDGLPVGNIYDGITPVPMLLKINNPDGPKDQNLENIPVWNMLPNIRAIGKDDIAKALYGLESIDDITAKLLRPVPLNTVTNGLNIGWEEMVVHRTDGKRSIEAQCDPVEGISPALLRKSLLKDINAIELPDGYNMRWVGEYELQNMALRNIFKFLPISIMLIVLTLIVLFNDFRRPIIVLACIPLAIIGIVPGLILTGKPFTFMAIIGSIGLAGMLIKNSIVLLDEINKKMHEGHGHYEAIIKATVSRTRPVIMASLTTILGMLPLFFDPMYSSMAVAIISGLLAGTIITLIFVPILYAVLFNIHKEKNVKILTD